MDWHTRKEAAEQSPETGFQTRSGLMPVWMQADELAEEKDPLLDLTLQLIRESDPQTDRPATPQKDEAEPRRAAVQEVADFFHGHANSYLTCYYIAIAVYEGGNYGDIRRFADSLWADFRQSLGQSSGEETRDSAFLSVKDILEQVHASLEDDWEDGDGTPWSRKVRFDNPYTARVCVRSVAEEYPILSEVLLRACVRTLSEQDAPFCRRLLSQWSQWDYFAVNRHIATAMEAGPFRGSAGSVSPNRQDAAEPDGAAEFACGPGDERLMAALLDALNVATGSARWNAMLLESAGTLWQREFGSISRALSIRSLELVAILTGNARMGGNPALLAGLYESLRAWAVDWYQRRNLTRRQWAVLFYTVAAAGNEESLWNELMQMLKADFDDRDREKRVAGFAMMTLMLYADCLLLAQGRPVMGILRHCASKRAHTAETAALLRHYCERNNRFLCLETILDEQLALMDAWGTPYARIWPFFKWMAFTGDQDDYDRWHDFLSRKAENGRTPSETAMNLVQQLQKTYTQVHQ